MRRSVADDELTALHEAGVRGVRFNFVKRLVDFTPRTSCWRSPRASPRSAGTSSIYFEAADLPELWDFFTALPTTVVVDHMGRPDVTKPADGPEFELFLEVHARAPERLEQGQLPRAPVASTGPPALDGEQTAYRDVVPFARRVVETFPDRVLWGTDWPHPNLKDHMPDDGLLVDFIPHIAVTAGAAAAAAGRQPDAAVLAGSRRR